MKARRIVLVVALSAIPLLGAANGAGAVPPTRDCPPAFLGPWTFERVVEEFPPPPEVPLEAIQAAFEKTDTNDDGSLCVRGLPNGKIVIVDNAANVP